MHAIARWTLQLVGGDVGGGGGRRSANSAVSDRLDDGSSVNGREGDGSCVRRVRETGDEIDDHEQSHRDETDPRTDENGAL